MTEKQELMNALVSHRVGWPEGASIEDLTTPITYVVDGSGVFQVKRLAVGVATTKAKVVRGVEARLAEGFVLTLPRLPFSLYQQAVVWFREVHRRWKTEAYLQVWWDPSREGYYVVVPVQDVSGGKVEHQGGQHDKSGELGHIHALDLHSHHTMGAFWSGVDDADERKSERLYGVVGKIDQVIPDSKWRVAVAGEFLDLGFGEIWQVPEEALTYQVSIKDLLSGKAPAVQTRLFEGITYPEIWDASLITEKPRAPLTGPGFHDYQAWNGHYLGRLPWGEQDDTRFDRLDGGDREGVEEVVPGVTGFHYEQRGKDWWRIQTATGKKVERIRGMRRGR